MKGAVVMDIEKLKNDMKRVEGKMENPDSIRVKFEYLKQETEYTGLFIQPIDNLDEGQDLYTMGETFKFGKKYIQNTPNNQKHLIDIPNLSEYVNKFSKVVRDNFELSYQKIDSIKFALFNPKNDPKITILTISYYNRISNFLKQLYLLYEKYKEDIYNLVVTVSLKNKNLTITPKKKIDNPIDLISKSYDIIEVQKRVFDFLNNKKDLEFAEIKSITQNWINSCVKYSNSDEETIHFEGNKIQKDSIKYDDDFFENIKKEEDSPDLFDTNKNPSPVDLVEDIDIPF